MLFASKMFLGMPSRSDTEVVSMGFLGFKPQPGDIVKSVGNNKAQLVTTTGGCRLWGGCECRPRGCHRGGHRRACDCPYRQYDDPDPACWYAGI